MSGDILCAECGNDCWIVEHTAPPLCESCYDEATRRVVVFHADQLVVDYFGKPEVEE